MVVGQIQPLRASVSSPTRGVSSYTPVAVVRVQRGDTDEVCVPDTQGFQNFPSDPRLLVMESEEADIGGEFCLSLTTSRTWSPEGGREVSWKEESPVGPD